jgi:hypothetical protein
VTGKRRARQIGETSALVDWRKDEAVPGKAVDNDSDTQEHIRHSLFPL